MYLVNLTNKLPLAHEAENKAPFSLKPKDKEFIMDMLKDCGPTTVTKEAISMRAEIIMERLNIALCTPTLFNYVGLSPDYINDENYRWFALELSRPIVFMEPSLHMAYELKKHAMANGIDLIFPLQ